MRHVTGSASTRRPKRNLLTGATVTALGGILALGLSACGTPADETDNADPSESTTTITTDPEQSTTGETVTPSASDSTTAESTPTSENSPPPAEPGAQPIGNPSTEDQWIQPEGEYDLMVTGVRVASHDGFDRVVFDLTGTGTPGWFTTYTETPSQQGSGHPIDYDGAIALQVGVDGTPYPFDLGTEMPELGTTPGAGNVTEVTYSSLFEARTEFVIGVTEKMPYSVNALSDPTRLVIDFHHN